MGRRKDYKTKREGDERAWIMQRAELVRRAPNEEEAERQKMFLRNFIREASQRGYSYAMLALWSGLTREEVLKICL